MVKLLQHLRIGELLPFPLGEGQSKNLSSKTSKKDFLQTTFKTQDFGQKLVNHRFPSSSDEGTIKTEDPKHSVSETSYIMVDLCSDVVICMYEGHVYCLPCHQPIGECLH